DTSDTVWVKSPVIAARGGADSNAGELIGASIVIWTTTPWTIPGNRAVSFSPKIGYGLYEVTDAPAENWAKVGDKFVLAEKLAVDVLRHAAGTAFNQLAPVPASLLGAITCPPPAQGGAGC